MQTHMRKLLSGLLLGCALCVLPAQADSLTPQQVTDLILKAFVNGDLKSARKLTDYYRAEDVPETEKIVQELAKNIPASMLQQWEAGPGQQMPELKPLASEFFANMFSSIQRSQCQTTKGQAAKADEEHAIVQYSCKVSDLDEARKQFLAIDPKELDANQAMTKNFLEKAAAAYRDAPFTKTVTGEITLRRTPNGNWESERPPYAVLQPVVENLSLLP